MDTTWETYLRIINLHFNNMLIIIYIIAHTVLGTLAHKCFSENSDEYNRQWLVILSVCFAPITFITALIMYPSFFFRWMIPKKKPKPIVPWTYNWYVWWEVVMVGDEKWIVIGSWFEKVHVLWINSSDSRYVDISEVTSTTKPSELAEELAMLDQANKLLSKADAIVKEAGEIKMKAVKKRTNLIYSPK